jgi:hypothetical protein
MPIEQPVTTTTRLATADMFADRYQFAMLCYLPNVDG